MLTVSVCFTCGICSTVSILFWQRYWSFFLFLQNNNGEIWTIKWTMDNGHWVGSWTGQWTFVEEGSKTVVQESNRDHRTVICTMSTVLLLSSASVTSEGGVTRGRRHQREEPQEGGHNINCFNCQAVINNVKYYEKFQLVCLLTFIRAGLVINNQTTTAWHPHFGKNTDFN